MKILKKSTAVLLALLIAFSAMSVAAAAEDGVPAEGRESFIAKEADCRILFNYSSVYKGDTVKMTAVGSYIDITETEAVPVEGDVRLVPVKWVAKQGAADAAIETGDWTELRTEQTADIETAGVAVKRGDDPVEVVVEVEFAKQEYKDGKWETIGEYTGSNKIIVKAETTTSFFSKLISAIINTFAFHFGGRFGPGVVSKGINDFIEKLWPRGTVVSTSEGDSVVGSVVEALGAIVIMIVEFFEDIFPWSK